MRKKRAKVLKALAIKEAGSKEFLALMQANPNGTFNRIHNGIKKLWNAGKI